MPPHSLLPEPASVQVSHARSAQTDLELILLHYLPLLLFALGALERVREIGVTHSPAEFLAFLLFEQASDDLVVSSFIVGWRALILLDCGAVFVFC